MFDIRTFDPIAGALALATLVVMMAVATVTSCAHTHPPRKCEHVVPEGHVVLTAPVIDTR